MLSSKSKLLLSSLITSCLDNLLRSGSEHVLNNPVFEEVQDDIPKDKDGKPHSGMAMALTTGHFDIRNTGVSTWIMYVCM